MAGTISDTGYKVWVNGAAAALSGNNWTATNVPVTAGRASDIPSGGDPADGQRGQRDAAPLRAGQRPGEHGTLRAPSRPGCRYPAGEARRKLSGSMRKWSEEVDVVRLPDTSQGSIKENWSRSETNGGADYVVHYHEPGGLDMTYGMHYTEGPSGHLWSLTRALRTSLTPAPN